MARPTPPDRTPPTPLAPAEGSPGDRPSWPPIRPVDPSAPRRDRRGPMRPRQIVLAVLVALGVGALLGSGALVGLAERQPLGTQRDVALGAAEAADRVAHGLSLNRPAERLAAALDGTEEVYDVEALIARARATAPAPAEPPAPPPVPEDLEDEVTAPPAEGDGAAAEEPTGTSEADPADGPPADGIITPIEGIDCVPEDSATPTTTTGAGGEGPVEQDRPSDPDPTGAAGDGATPGSGDVEDPADLDAATEPDSTEAQSGEPAIDELEQGPRDAAGEDGAGPADPTDCPPGFVPAAEAPVQETDPSTDRTAPDGSDPTADPAEAPEPITFDAPRIPEEDRPLVMYVGGDSISRDLGEGLARITPADLVRIDLDPRPATGLSRPDFFDWAQHLAGVLIESVPDVIVVLFGANDFQNVEYEGEILDRFGDEWLDLYGQRVDRIMTLLSQPEVQTVWVGQPPVREPRLSGGLERLNAVYAEVAAQHPQVTYLDTWALFSDSDGGYVDEIDGVRLRREDGVHLTVRGGDRLAEAVWDVVGPAWGLG